MSRRWHGVWLRWCTLVLLALALPMQGLAAATMQHCQSAAGQAEMHRVQQADTAFAQAAGIAAHTGCDPAPQADAKCSVCAASCAAAALPPSVPELPLIEAHGEPIAFTAPDCPAALARSLERPPRLDLA